MSVPSQVVDHDRKLFNDKNIIRAYHGQVIAKEELEQIQSSIGGFISINRFFSTSRIETKARNFAKLSKVTENLRRILFRIEIDPQLPTKPFADIGEEALMVTLGNILLQMGEYDKAERIFLRLNHQEGPIIVLLNSKKTFIQQ